MLLINRKILLFLLWFIHQNAGIGALDVNECSKGENWCKKEVETCKNDCDCDGDRICIMDKNTSFCSGMYFVI